MSVRIQSVPRVSDRFAARRRARRGRIAVALVVLILLSGAGIAYELRQSAVRIANIAIVGADQSLSGIAAVEIRGDYFGIIPRDSIFFFPASRIRASIMAAHPDIAAVSVARNGLSSISISPNYRVPIARWCGAAPASTSAQDAIEEEISPVRNGDCYVFDANGLLYATATPAGSATTTDVSKSPSKTIAPFILFSALESDDGFFIYKTLKDADRLPVVFDFARQVGTLGASVTTVVIRGDEVDFFLPPASDHATSPRITYLLGDEQNAFTALISAKEQLNLLDPALQYIDARFPGKIYVKRSEAPKEPK